MKNLHRYLLLDFPVKLKALEPDAKARFGEMNVIQMLDHLRKAFVLSYSQGDIEVRTPEEHIERAQAFLASDKPILPGAEIPREYADIEAIEDDLDEMKLLVLKEMVAMLSHYENNPRFSQNHPVFGRLTRRQWLQLHKKHTEHHLRQFGID
ncbi:MAG: DUF1569 domain-containing protein [Croceimicrobium sp.]|nr:DUF1569 domain-containing protein [Bacteroidota bacterium]